jgi:hypothetical protein
VICTPWKVLATGRARVGPGAGTTPVRKSLGPQGATARRGPAWCGRGRRAGFGPRVYRWPDGRGRCRGRAGQAEGALAARWATWGGAWRCGSASSADSFCLGGETASLAAVATVDLKALEPPSSTGRVPWSARYGAASEILRSRRRALSPAASAGWFSLVAGIVLVGAFGNALALSHRRRNLAGGSCVMAMAKGRATASSGEPPPPRRGTDRHEE